MLKNSKKRKRDEKNVKNKKRKKVSFAEINRGEEYKNIQETLKTLQKHIKENTFKRSKFYGDIEKYIDSEIDICEDLKKLTGSITTRTDFYKPFVNDLNALNILKELFGHENPEILNELVTLFSEITDPEVVNEREDTIVLFDEIVNQKIIEMIASIVSSGRTFSIQTLYNCLNILENVNQIAPEAADIVCKNTKLIGWILDYLQFTPQPKKENKATNENEEDEEDEEDELVYNENLYFYSCEIIAIIISSSDFAISKFRNQQNLEKLINSLFLFKEKNVKSADCIEAFHNLMDALCSLCLDNQIKELFREANGIPFFLKLTKLFKFARFPSFKLFNSVLLNNPDNCNTFVQSGGFKIFFALFMKKKKKKKKKQSSLAMQIVSEDNKEVTHSEHLISILFSIVKNIGSGGSIGTRIHKKFKEKEFAKTEKLFSFFSFFEKKVIQFEQSIQTGEYQRKLQEEEFIVSKEELEDQIFLSRLECGFISLVQICLILCYLMKEKELKQKIEAELKEKKIEKTQIFGYINMYTSTLNDKDDFDFCEQLKKEMQ